MKNIKMLNYFDKTFTSKLNYEYKNKTLLNIISNLSELKKNSSFNTKLNTKLQLLNKIEKKILNSKKNINITKSLLISTNSLTNNSLTNNNLNNNKLNNRSLFSSIENDNDKKLNNININKELLNKNNIMIPRTKQNITNQNQINKNLITRIKNIDSNLKNNINLPLNIIGKPALNVTNKNYLNLITKFNPEIAKVKNTLFNFNLNNNKILKNVYTILEYSFKSMNCLISKPYLYIFQDKIIINLFFFKKVLPTLNVFKHKRNRHFNKYR